MPMNKIKVELSKLEVDKIIQEAFQSEYPEYEVKTIIYNMTNAGYERNEPFGHKFTGIEIGLEK